MDFFSKDKFSSLRYVLFCVTLMVCGPDVPRPADAAFYKGQADRREEYG